MDIRHNPIPVGIIRKPGDILRPDDGGLRRREKEMVNCIPTSEDFITDIEALLGPGMLEEGPCRLRCFGEANREGNSRWGIERRLGVETGLTIRLYTADGGTLWDMGRGRNVLVGGPS